ncbi:hypothetical protein AVEN_92498-1 [Araneus ventricosus]|uniref:Uncharacterized protein n=1 Tax=Araneus ventricosus TaxID=182803 RepID=A0A4Y2AHI9_ARAVE|nr:hypothetical protein AVEN_92498-1 [Araneus ventricosus]
MAFLAKHRKEELIALADDMGIEISSNDKKIDICKKVKDSPDFEEEFVRCCLEEIDKQREELKAQAEAAELKRTESLRQEREFELEKMRISNAADVNSVASTRSENSKNRLSLKNLMQKFDAQVSDISMYLALFERQARTAGIEETEWVPQLISLLPLDLAQRTRGKNAGLSQRKRSFARQIQNETGNLPIKIHPASKKTWSIMAGTRF